MRISPLHHDATTPPTPPTTTTLSLLRSELRQVRPLLRKNFLIKLRNKKTLVVEVFLPLLYLAILLTLVRVVPVITFPPMPPSAPLTIPLYKQLQLESKAAGMTLGYAPNTSEAAHRIMLEVASSFPNATLVPLLNHSEIDRYVTEGLGEPLFAAVEFLNIGEMGDNLTQSEIDHLDLLVRPKYGSLPSLTDSAPAEEPYCRSFDSPNTSDFFDSCAVMKYATSGFLDLQTELHLAVARELSSSPPPNVTTNVTTLLQTIPRPSYTTSPSYLSLIAAIYVVIAFWPFVSYIITAVVEEKEKGWKELMSVMGLTNVSYSASWLMTFGLVGLLTSLLMTIVMVGGGITPHSNFFLIWVMLALYALSAVGYSLCITPFFSNPKMASVMGSMISAAFSVIYLPLVQSAPNASPASLWACSLLSPIALAVGIGQTMRLELDPAYGKHGLQFSNVWEDGVVAGGFSVGSSYVMLMIDILIYVLFAYSVGEAKGEYRSTTNVAPSSSTSSDFFSSESIEVKIRSLRKEYGKETVALDDLTMDIAGGQIYGFIGPNGSGKSTLLSILCGIIKPTSGTTEILPAPPRDIGYCPQSNCLFDYLTVEEHFDLFEGLKRSEGDFISKEELMRRLGLDAIRKERCMTLSGGQKRRVSLGIAIMGGPKLIVLDEPTDGMDVQARREILDLLREIKPGRLILLTSHHLEEMDVLADRMAILTKGKAMCEGTSLYLKSRFGLGFALHAQLSQGGTEGDDDDETEGRILGWMRGIIPEVVYEGRTGSRATFRVPPTHSSHFPRLLRELETKKRELKIDSYDVGMTTLDDVFLRLYYGDGDASLTASTTSTTSAFRAREAEVRKRNSTPSSPPPVCVLPTMRESVGILTRFKLKQIRRSPNVFLYNITLASVFQIIGVVLAVTSSSSSTSLDPTGTALAVMSQFPQSYSAIPILTTSSPPAAPSNLPFNSTLVAEVANQTWYSGNPPLALINLPHLLINPQLPHVLPAMWGPLLSSYVGFAKDNFTIDYFISTLPNADTAAPTFTAGASFGTVLLFGLSFVNLPVNLAADWVQERASGARHQLLLTGGVSPLVHALSCILRDLALCGILAGITVIIVFAAQINCIVEYERAIAFVLAVILYLPVMVVFAHLVSRAFKLRETYLVIIPAVGLLALIPFLIVGILDQIQVFGSIPTTIHYVVMSLDPPYGFIGTTYFICRSSNVAGDEDEGVFGFPPGGGQVSGSLLIMAAQLILEGFVLYATMKREERRWGNAHVQHDLAEVVEEEEIMLDSQVKREMERVKRGIIGYGGEVEEKEEEDVIMVAGLTKVYDAPFFNTKKKGNVTTMKKKPALQNAWFGVKRGEVFGLLGPNGSGKTTCLSIISGALSATSGHVVWGGEGGRSLGYAPQQHALVEELTVREHLELFSLLRGVVGAELRESNVVASLKSLNMSEFGNVQARHLSGGTKRKLTFCVAAVGHPRLFIMDEPSSGMDPTGRNLMWEAISEFAIDRACILTTHNMEEADALSTRVGVIVKGRMRALGSTHDLKAQFGKGYRLEVKIIEGLEREFEERILQRYFPGYVAVDDVKGNHVYQVPTPPNLGEAFAILEESRRNEASEATTTQSLVEDYALSETTLERVFEEIVGRSGGTHYE